MKFTQIITGCALAAGLMVFTAGSVQAGTVINNNLYTPLNAKVVVQYVDSKNNIKQATGTTKELLKSLGFNGKVTLAAGPGSNGRQVDVYVINQANGGSVIANVSTNYDNETGYYMVIDPNSLISTDKSSNNDLNYQWNDLGQVHVLFYGVNSDSVETDLDLNGTYSLKGSDKYTKNSSNYTENVSFKSSNLSGKGYVSGLNNDWAPATGSISGNGSGKLVD